MISLRVSFRAATITLPSSFLFARSALIRPESKRQSAQAQLEVLETPRPHLRRPVRTCEEENRQRPRTRAAETGADSHLTRSVGWCWCSRGPDGTALFSKRTAALHIRIRPRARSRPPPASNAPPKSHLEPLFSPLQRFDGEGKMVSQAARDRIYLAFLLIHIPATLLVGKLPGPLQARPAHSPPPQTCRPFSSQSGSVPPSFAKSVNNIRAPLLQHRTHRAPPPRPLRSEGRPAPHERQLAPLRVVPKLHHPRDLLPASRLLPWRPGPPPRCASPLVASDLPNACPNPSRIADPGSKSIYPLLALYGASSATTTWACLATVVTIPGIAPQLPQLLGSYIPFFLVPLSMAIDYGMRLTQLSEREEETVKAKAS